jgi:hypothetical protein
MRFRLLTMIALAILAAYMLPARAVAQSTDPVVVTKTYVTAVDAGNVDGGMAVISRTAVVRFSPAPAGQSAVVVGSSNIRVLTQSDVARHTDLVVVGGYHVAGDTVTWHVVRTDDTFRAAHIAGPQITMVAVVRDGKIVSLTYKLSPAALVAYRLALGAATTPQMPATGEGGMARTSAGQWSRPLPLLVALVLLAGLIALTARNRRPLTVKR